MTKHPSWPPRPHRCQFCDYETQLVSLFLLHMKTEHPRGAS